MVHCTNQTRPDGAGGAVNCRILGLADRLRREHGIAPTQAGTDGARLVPELGEDPRDLVVARWHGLTPFTSTPLDQTLRNLDIRTVVATGVSVNVGILGLCLSAADLGYQVVLVRDAVAGVPAGYAESVIENTLGDGRHGGHISRAAGGVGSSLIAQRPSGLAAIREDSAGR